MSVPRRRILHALVAAPLLPALGDGAAPAPQVSPAPAPSAAVPAPATTPGVTARDELAGALVKVVEARYGSQLEPAELDAIRKGIGDALENSEKLRAVRLGNGDEPVTLFHARPPRRREDDATHGQRTQGAAR